MHFDSVIINSCAQTTLHLVAQNNSTQILFSISGAVVSWVVFTQGLSRGGSQTMAGAAVRLQTSSFTCLVVEAGGKLGPQPCYWLEHLQEVFLCVLRSSMVAGFQEQVSQDRIQAYCFLWPDPGCHTALRLQHFTLWKWITETSSYSVKGN